MVLSRFLLCRNLWHTKFPSTKKVSRCSDAGGLRVRMFCIDTQPWLIQQYRRQGLNLKHCRLAQHHSLVRASCGALATRAQVRTVQEFGCAIVFAFSFLADDHELHLRTGRSTNVFFLHALLRSLRVRTGCPAVQFDG